MTGSTPVGPGHPDDHEDLVDRVVAAIASRDDLLEMAYVMESEAVERYVELADQMEVHNNTEVAELFAKLAEIERKHVDQLAGKLDLSKLDQFKDYRWIDPEAPETINFEDVHYLMTPHHALVLARHNEQRAEAFYRAVAERATSEDVRVLAQELADDEREHVVLIGKWLQQFPEPEEGWDEDPDPPHMPE